MQRSVRQLTSVLDISTCRRLRLCVLDQIWTSASKASPWEAPPSNWSDPFNKRMPLDRRWNSHSSNSTASVLNTEGSSPTFVENQDSVTKPNSNELPKAIVHQVDGIEGVNASPPTETDANAGDKPSPQETETDGSGDTNIDHIPLAYDLPRDWYSQTMSPSLRRDRLVMHLSEWAKRRILTPKLLLKLLQGPLSPHELSRYTSNNISRIVYAIGLIKKTDRLIGHPATIEAFLKHLYHEATDRKRLMTYDGIGLSQTAFGFSMMKLEDPHLFRPFAEEAIKPHRIRNTLGKSLVNLLDSLYHGGYENHEHVEIISRAAVDHVTQLPTFALPRLINAWGHFKYNNTSHIRAVLTETLKESRLNSLLAIHIEEILSACAKMQFKETKFIMAFMRELIYSQKWKFMTHGSLPRIVWAMGTLQYEYPSHWRQILDATLADNVLISLESNLIVDIYVGWSKVSYRDSQMLDRLGSEAVRKKRLDVYSTRQLFEIFKAQRLLGQFEKKYTRPIIEKLQDTEKLMKCNVETKIQMVLQSNIKTILGMENIEALMKAICQELCLEPLGDHVLIQLAHRQATIGNAFGRCFGEVVKEATKLERLQGMDTSVICQLLGAWHRLGHTDDAAVDRVMTECSVMERLQSASAEEVLKLIWTLRQINNKVKMQSLLREAMQRPVATFTVKGIAMILSAVVEHEFQKDEMQPFVEALVKDNGITAASSSMKTEIVSLLKSMGFEDAGLRLEDTKTSNGNIQTVDDA